MSNLKQIGLGVMMYAQDNDGRLPIGGYTGTVSPGISNGGQWFGAPRTYWFWQNMIYPYVKSVQVFVCPSSPAASTHYTAPTGNYGPYLMHYGANDGVDGQRLFPKAGYHTFPIDLVASPSKAYMITESPGNIIDYTWATGPRSDNTAYLPGGCAVYPSSTVTENDCWGGRHFGGVNVAFVDGHVKWLKAQTMSTEANKPGQGGWNPANE